MKNRIPDGHWLITKASAHRGFHGNGIPENSRGAFEKAIELGYPIETDVQLTSDLVPVCFHDDTLNRMTGKDARIWDVSFEELRKLRLADSDEQIMTFEEFLNLVDGRVPLLIEIKSQPPHNEDVSKKVVELLKGYKGDYVIQSFDPRVMKIIRKIAPSIIRGQLIEPEKSERVKPLTHFLLSHGLLNFMSKPDFINYNAKYLPLSRRMKRGKRVLCWTIRSEEEEQKALPYVESYVFENIDPKLK